MISRLFKCLLHSQPALLSLNRFLSKTFRHKSLLRLYLLCTMFFEPSQKESSASYFETKYDFPNFEEYRVL